jgi:hypothetical protein
MIHVGGYMKTFLLIFLALSAATTLVNAGEITEIDITELANAAEIREIELNDGSVITGEIVSLSGGIYTIRSTALGTVQVEESKVRTIRSKGSSGATGGTAGQLKSLQEKMMSDGEVMNTIQTLQNDPEFQKILEDPEIMKAVQAGDINALMANPRFMELLNKPAVQEIGKRISQ